MTKTYDKIVDTLKDITPPIREEDKVDNKPVLAVLKLFPKEIEKVRDAILDHLGAEHHNEMHYHMTEIKRHAETILKYCEKVRSRNLWDNVK